ncbi:MAG: hypothetical protein ABSH17_13345 [Syntrophobacteraceae bacterium]|jgi:hypothetical protein
MKRWIIFILFSILLSYPAVPDAADNSFDPGKGTSFSYPFMQVPIDSPPDSGAAKGEKGQGEARNDDKKEKQIRDKKVDDAIKKAWEEK